MIKVAFPTDEHYPYQDERARQVALEIVRDFDPDVRFAGSDGLDFYRLSRFDKDPMRIFGGNLQQEIDQWRAGQKEWREASPNAEVFYIPGNHEYRLIKFIWRLPEFHGIKALELPNLLGLEALGIPSEIHDEVLVGDKLLVRHGELVRKDSAYSAKAEMEKDGYSISLLTGHTHRGGTTYLRTRNGVIQAHECFCLCSLKPDYSRYPNWQQGIVLATVTENGPIVEPILFHRPSEDRVYTLWRGKEYRA